MTVNTGVTEAATTTAGVTVDVTTTDGVTEVATTTAVRSVCRRRNTSSGDVKTSPPRRHTTIKLFEVLYDDKWWSGHIKFKHRNTGVIMVMSLLLTTMMTVVCEEGNVSDTCPHIRPVSYCSRT